ncbi:MAG: bifunctional (p)ppGpp synthetase/guanosine-3',5'-bis(diphosphate) 3'-pyrophosphohydrolase [Erysipelotrichales bacterium]|nr:bifunctional (p)ppGpp synthetase/guanosine-3',5'-bis(diphosphate) 3'-pyrophosphohydrolase [Erysipelotrichales bacterium]
MNERFNELLQICEDNRYTSKEIELIKKAYKFASLEHEGMLRKNKDPYITHPLEVAIIVANLNTDAATVVAALVHETIDHGSSNYETIEELFGEDVKNIVVSLAKVNHLHLTDDSESSALYLRKVLVALSEDVRVIILKLAGRVHNLRTAEGLSKEKQKQKALETWNVLIPIAHRLGINQLKSELEDLSFKFLKPEIYVDIENELPAPREELEEDLNLMMEEITDVLRDHNLKFEIKGRVKSVSSLHNKLSNGKKWSDIYDILGIRIICEEESDCYLIIGIIHSLYRPIPRRFKDYIAMPKGNSYQSLHTGVFGSNGYPVEVQVRTKEMNEIAEHGVASHWSYKEKNSKNIQSVMEQKLQMFRNTIEANSDEVSDDQTFANNIEEELLSSSIYVFTPKGDVVELPQGSTPIDFAYRIHSRVGDTTVGALVNDQMVPLDYALNDNDIIKIMTDKNSSPNKDWLNFVKTSAAKAKIKSFFSKQDKEEYVARGKELLERELRRQKISITNALTDEHQEKLIKDLKLNNFEEVLLNIGSLRYTPVYIVNLLFEDKKNVQDLLVDKIMNTSSVPKINYKNDVIVSGCDNILVNLASCCKPVMGDDIIGYITKGHGVTVHRSDCQNMKGITERLVQVIWNENNEVDDKRYVSKLVIETNTHEPKVLDIVTKATLRNITVSSMNELNHNGVINFNLLVKVQNRRDLDLFVDELLTLPFIVAVRR